MIARVLVVAEGTEPHRSSVAATLRAGGFDVLVAVTEAEGQQLAAAERFDVVVLDTDPRDRDVCESCRSLYQLTGGLLPVQSLEFAAILDAGGRFRYVSPSAYTTLGYAPEQLIGTNAVDLVHPDERAATLDAFDKLVHSDGGAVAQTIRRLRHADGSWRHFEGSGQNRLEDPAVRGITFSAYDISIRVEAERVARDRESRFRGYVGTAREAIWAVDPRGNTTYFNARATTMLGYAPGDMSASAIFAFMSDASAADARAAFEKGEHSELLELDFVAQDGRVIPTLVAASSIVDDGQADGGVLLMITDISERKEAERQMADALRTADLDRRRLEATLQAIPVGVSIFNAYGQLTHSNPAASRLDSGRPDDAALRQVLGTGETVSGEMIEVERSGGARAYVLNSAAPVLDAAGEITGAVVVNVDITNYQRAVGERERLLASLEVERQRLAMIFEHAPAFMGVMRGPTYIFERVNPALQELVGPRELVGKPVVEAIPEIAEQGFVELLDLVRHTGRPFIGKQLPVRLARVPGGPLEERFVDMVYLRLDDPDGEIRVVSHGVDVTEQVVAANALRESEQRLREQFAKLPVPTFLWESRDDDFVLIDMNDAARPLIDPSWTDAVGRTATDLLPLGWPIREDVVQCLRDGIAVRRSVVVDSGRGLDPRTFDLVIGPQHPDRVIVHTTETTGQTRLANELRQAQKMEAVGQLAGGVAHDFNNMLTVIGAHSAFLLENLAESDPRRADARAIQEAGDHAAGLTRQLLAFSRKQILMPSRLDVNVVVDETRRMLDRVLGEDIKVVLFLQPQLPAVMADRGQLEQVLMNLALNARDAMPAGGCLSISTGVTGSSMADNIGIGLPTGDYVILSVADTGSGMDPDTQTHLFEPFFTTKEFGKGTGLGLSTVHGIVNQSGGHVRVRSALNAGATFEIFLPVAVTDSEPDFITPDVPPPTRGHETVLLVEDDAAVRRIARRILEGEGYNVLEAAGGQEALALAASHTGRIDVVITDAVMPGMTGAALLTCLATDRPACRAVMMSGYTDDEMTRRGISAPNVFFIQKPFKPSHFAQQVRLALDA